MGMCNCSSAVHTGIGIMQIGIFLLLIVIGYASPNWADYSVAGVNIHFGLWDTCTSGECQSVPDPSDQTKAARAFGMLSIFTAVAVIGLAIFFLVKKNKKMVLVAAIVSEVTFVLSLIYLIVGIEEISDTTTDYGFCFGLTISGVIQAFFAGLTFFGAYRKASCEQS